MGFLLCQKTDMLGFLFKFLCKKTAFYTKNHRKQDVRYTIKNRFNPLLKNKYILDRHTGLEEKKDSTLTERGAVLYNPAGD